MPRVLFLESFSYKPSPQQTFYYEKGDLALVTQDIADKAISKGKAELTTVPIPNSGIKETIKKFPRSIKKKTEKEIEDSFLEEPSAFVDDET